MHKQLPNGRHSRGFDCSVAWA